MLLCLGCETTSIGMNCEQNGMTLSSAPTDLYFSHTSGSVCFSLAYKGKSGSEERLLLSGDTLFRRGIGRTDLPGGDSAQIMASIRGRLLTLDDDTGVIPGHGPATHIGEERTGNKNGEYDRGESRLEGVKLKLSEIDGDTEEIVYSSSFGQYAFDDLPAAGMAGQSGRFQ